MSNKPHPARITVTVYKAADGIRWRIESAARGRRIISASSEAYVRKGDAFRGLLLTTGGTYESDVRFRTPRNGAYEQGLITRPLPFACPQHEHGCDERIFVEYISGNA